jgi:hypothetical protein
MVLKHPAMKTKTSSFPPVGDSERLRWPIWEGLDGLYGKSGVCESVVIVGTIVNSGVCSG